MDDKTKEIRNFWELQAEKYGASFEATVPDKYAKDLEIKNILKYLKNDADILDVGCGNGYSTLKFATMLDKSSFIGMDYSKKMIEIANNELIKLNADLQKRVSFRVGDILKLDFGERKFDIVTSDRCLINLPSLEKQVKAAENIWRVLKKEGKYVMCENTIQGLNKLNEMRKIAELKEIPMRWHNLYIDENKFLNKMDGLFRIETVDNFISLYYIASRIFNAKLAEMEGKEPDYNHPINEMASKLPSVGNYGPLKIFVLTKKG